VWDRWLTAVAPLVAASSRPPCPTSPMRSWPGGNRVANSKYPTPTPGPWNAIVSRLLCLGGMAASRLYFREGRQPSFGRLVVLLHRHEVTSYSRAQGHEDLHHPGPPLLLLCFNSRFRIWPRVLSRTSPPFCLRFCGKATLPPGRTHSPGHYRSTSLT